jgi:glutathione-independent formaldehyde dehydrogenase
VPAKGTASARGKKGLGEYFVKAVVYQEPFSVAVEEVEDAQVLNPTDVVIRITSTAICGSDLHMYEGRTGAQPGIIFGHENQGIVEEVGDGVSSLSVGDRINLPFNVACGFCANCEAGNTGFCLTANTDFAGAAYGYVNMGPYTGGQAEYLRVPWADFNALRLPGEEGDEFENDFILLSDIFPTGWHATVLGGVEPGNTVAIYGAGPVGIMAAYSAVFKGAERVFMVDRVQNRLDLAESVGEGAIIPVNFDEVEPVDYILDQTEGNGTDVSIDAVGYQATVSGGGEEQPAVVLNQCIYTTRATGRLGVVGLYVPEDPGAPTEEAAEGRLLIEIGKFFEKGLSMGTGQCNVKRYNRALRDLIVQGRVKPSFVVSKEVPLEEAPDSYHRFDQREEGYSKVVLKPGQ